jgi:hypothetical protein
VAGQKRTSKKKNQGTESSAMRKAVLDSFNVKCRFADAVKRLGKPEVKNKEVCQAIILELVAEGVMLAQICREPNMPSLTTVYNWRDADPQFALKLASAREIGFEQMAVETVMIAATPHLTEKITVTESGAGKRKHRETKRERDDAIHHRRLQIDTRLKLLACWDPKRYGQKVDLTGELQHTHSFPSAFAEAMKQETDGAERPAQTH